MMQTLIIFPNFNITWAYIYFPTILHVTIFTKYTNEQLLLKFHIIIFNSVILF